MLGLRSFLLDLRSCLRRFSSTLGLHLACACREWTIDIAGLVNKYRRDGQYRRDHYSPFDNLNGRPLHDPTHTERPDRGANVMSARGDGTPAAKARQCCKLCLQHSQPFSAPDTHSPAPIIPPSAYQERYGVPMGSVSPSPVVNEAPRPALEHVVSGDTVLESLMPPPPRSTLLS